MKKQLLVFALFGLSTAAVQALPQNSPVPGGIAVLDLGPQVQPAPTARWAERPLAVVSENGRWYALLGIPLDALPGELDVAITQGANKRSLVVPVRPKSYPEQRLTIKDKRKVEPNADDLARIAREQKITETVKQRFSDHMPDTAFKLPANGPLSSRFGLKRIFNGLPRNPHAGLDVAVGSGTPVHAPADGLIANTGDYFFNGNTIFIDHGQGLISAYMHLSRLDVREGQTVKKGELIGAVGATGRVTGPHLHWAAILNNTLVDPELLLAR